jgi:hypothetical protein
VPTTGEESKQVDTTTKATVIGIQLDIC